MNLPVPRPFRRRFQLQDAIHHSFAMVVCCVAIGTRTIGPFTMSTAAVVVLTVSKRSAHAEHFESFFYNLSVEHCTIKLRI